MTSTRFCELILPVCALFVSMALAPAARSADAPYAGTWALDKANCGKDQAEEEAPMIMTAAGYNQHEAHCTFKSIKETGASSWHAATECMVEGSPENGELSFAVEGDTLSLGEGEAIFQLSRCGK